MRQLKIFLLVMICALLAGAGPALAAKRVALVIGNSAYQSVANLANPAHDAAAVAEGLKRLGFTTVEHRPDLDYRNFRRVLSNFSRLADGADMALIYYAGHGIEINKRNYLVPVDAQLRDARDADLEALPLDVVLNTLEGARTLRLVILDACRNNPFRARMTKRGSTRSVGRGLARVDAPSNTLVAYAAKEGTTADDGKGTHSPYTTALLKHLETPGLEINFLFRRVRDTVLDATGGRQEPFMYGSLSSEAIYLKGGPDAGAPPVGSSAQPSLSASAEAWNAIKDTEDKAILKSFIARFEDSFYATLAKSRMASLQPPQEVESRDPDVTMELQKALKTASCYSGKIDGKWGSGSQSALRRFAEVTGRDLISDNASSMSLEFVRRHSGTICPSQPDKQRSSKLGKKSANSGRPYWCAATVRIYRKSIASGEWHPQSEAAKYVRQKCRVK